MNFRKISYLFLSATVALGGMAISDSAEAKTGKSRTRTSQTSKKKSRPKKRYGSSRKSKSRKTYRPYTPPVETPSYDSLTNAVNSSVVNWIPQQLNPGGLRVNSVKIDANNRQTKVSLNENFTYLPVTQEFINDLKHHLSSILPDSVADYGISLNVGNRNLAYYITKVDRLPENDRKNPPFVEELNPPIDPSKGMKRDIIALWPSHGRYYRPSGGSWMWQRPLLFGTAEDTFTMGYVLPYLVPMLENAGATVLLPRERDISKTEVIVDNDTNPEGNIYSQPYYKEMTGSTPWTTGDGEGFIYDLPDFRDTENPFENGTYRQTTTVKSGKPSVAAWYADIPDDGEYAVYVSYKSLPESTDDARYTVNYSGGSKEFRVNQTMGGGTWIYLGTFPLEKGYSDTEPVVTLSNISSASGKIITADAVKIGGGMGNIARSPKRSDIYYDPSTPEDTSGTQDDEEDENDENEETTADEAGDGQPAAAPEQTTQTQSPSKGKAPVFRTSGMPRFLEGARYWLHWAGAPERVYSPYHGSDDYKDDYTSRGHWVNWLAGGSRVLPGKEGLNIPVDLAFALHSDAGKRADDSFVGTLGIYYTNGGDSYKDGTARMNSRMLTDMIMRQITGDIRQNYEPRWTRRPMWDKSYVEARVSEVPTTLIELMSHQNFADMQYGLDPQFRFDVARSIYKGMARFLSERKDRQLTIQPLPVKNFSIRRTKKNHYRLQWHPVDDPLEPTAKPDKYIIYERTGDELGFHWLGETSSTHFDVRTSDNLIHSFRIVAANDGGMSFPSETLAFREAPSESQPVLVINGFTRISGPGHFSDEGRAGFDSENDFGVPYVRDISFMGHQTEFRRGAGESFGRSSGNMASKVIAGNTFDYPALHGRSIAAAGRGFVSASAGAVENDDIRLNDYKTVDLILGKQKTTVIGNGRSGIRHQAYPEKLQKALAGFTSHGGRLMVSGQYIASDAGDYRNGAESAGFAADVLGIVAVPDAPRSHSGRIRSIAGSLDSGVTERSYTYSTTLNDSIYIVEKADVLQPADGMDSDVLLEFSDTDEAAGLLTKKGRSRGAVMSVPFEAIIDQNRRDALMKEILDFLEH